jgi:SAM-dependent methyltransferase
VATVDDDEGTTHNLQGLYARRFDGRTNYRDEVWRTLIRSYFVRWVPSDAAVMDVGCGYGEFINNVAARTKYAMDLNPDAAAVVSAEVNLVQQDCSSPWGLADQELDVVFSSNFLEHLPSKHHVHRTLEEAFRCLRPGGRLILLGPNLRFVGGEYWDFFDHHVPLTDRSVVEAVVDCGFQIEEVRPRFLPYTMSSGRHYPSWVLRTYLRLPLAWRFVGKQFLVVASRPT